MERPNGPLRSLFPPVNRQAPASVGDPACDHGVTFDVEAAKTMGASSVRLKFPRLFGKCPKGCGFDGIAYASMAHCIYGDW
jgi:hypothetical protein